MSEQNKKAKAGEDVEKAPVKDMLNAAFEEYKKRVSRAGTDAVRGAAGEMAGMKTPFTGSSGLPDFRSVPFMSAPGMPPYPGAIQPMPGIPFAGAPPMPGVAPVQPGGARTMESGIIPQVGGMMKLGVDVVNTSLMTWLKVMEGFGGGGSLPHSYHSLSGCGSYDHSNHGHSHGGHGSCHSVSSCCEPEPSCCSCEPSVNNCC